MKRISAKKRGYNLQEVVQQVFKHVVVRTHHWYNGIPLAVHASPKEPTVRDTNVKLSHPGDSNPKLTIDFGDIGMHSSLTYGSVACKSPLGWAKDIVRVARNLGVIDDETEVEVLFTATEDNAIWNLVEGDAFKW